MGRTGGLRMPWERIGGILLCEWLRWSCWICRKSHSKCVVESRVRDLERVALRVTSPYQWWGWGVVLVGELQAFVFIYFLRKGSSLEMIYLCSMWKQGNAVK